MSIDRSKFKASSNAAVVEKEKQADRIAGKTNGNRADTLSIEEGYNRFRIYPVHPDGPVDATYSEPVSRVFLPMMIVEKDKEGNEIMEKGKPKMKETYKPLFNSKLHGGTQKDLVEEYTNIAKRKAEGLSGSDKEAFLNKINGKFANDAASRLPGCQYQQTSVMYADKLTRDGSIEKFGRLEVKPMVKRKMNEVAALESANDPMGVDPFSDAEEGLPIIINFNKPVKGQKTDPNSIYAVALDKNHDRATKMLIEYPLTDAQLEQFLTYPSLAKLFRNAFKKKDFQLQLEGLEYFDAKYDIGVFEQEEFMMIAEEISNYYSEESEVVTEEELEKVQSGTVAEEEEEAEELAEANDQDQFDIMGRAELKQFNAAKKLGVVIKPSMVDDVVRQAIREAWQNSEIPHIPLPDKNGKDLIPKAEPTPNYLASQVVEHKGTTQVTSGGGASARIAALRSGKK